MTVNRQEEMIVFDFLDHLRRVQEAKTITPLEKSIIDALDVALSCRKIACFACRDEGDTILRYDRGFEPSELPFITDLLKKENLDAFTHGLTVFEKGGLKNAVVLGIRFDSYYYLISAVLQQPISPHKIEVAGALAQSLEIVLETKSHQPDVLATQFNELVLQNIMSGIIVIDRNEQIVFLNKAGEMILGYRFEELKDAPSATIFREIDSEKNWLTFTLTTGCVSSRKKIYMVRRDNIEIEIGGTTSLLKGENGDILGVIGIFREYDDFRKDENKRKDLNKMSTLSKLSASIAHEIRNPLAGISATAQVLASKLEEDDRKKKFVTVILEEIDRINRIIKELLNFASPSKASFLKSNVNKILEDGISLLHKKIIKQSIEVVREYDRELPDILCDEAQLKQALINIMLNSVSAMPEGGLLCVMTEITQLETKKCIKITVQDSGPGIPAEVLHDLFSPFTTTKTQGLGLGLTITKNIIKAHNGKIEAVNLPEKGACVVVYLPLKHTESVYDEQPYLPFEDSST